MGMTSDEKRALKGGHATALPPRAARISQFCAAYGFSRSETYRRLSSGDISAVKLGGQTLILSDSADRFLASLPAATFRKP